MSIYDLIDSNLIRRGEELFPFASWGQPRDYDKIAEALQVIPYECDRYLSVEELLLFYD